MKQTALLVALCCMMTLAACATVPVAHSFAGARQSLSNGDVIDVRDSTGAMQKGELVELSPTSLVILGRDRVELGENAVTQIRREESQRGRGALVGLGAGFVIGILAARQSVPSGCAICDAEGAAINALFTMGVGAGVGAIVGGFVKAHRIVYQRPSPATP